MAEIDLAREGKNVMNSKTVVESPWEEAGEGVVKHITGRRLMGLVIFDTTHDVGILRQRIKSAEYSEGV